MRLPELVTRERDLASEVGSLNSDMQQLVYENYSKFVTATDTIRSMAGAMATMEPQMEQLKDLLSRVAEESDMVSSKLEQRQKTVEDLTRMRTLLEKLQAVFELPRRLRACMAAGNVEAAVGLYEEVRPLLQRHGSKVSASGRNVNLSRPLSHADSETAGGACAARREQQCAGTSACALFLMSLHLFFFFLHLFFIPILRVFAGRIPACSSRNERVCSRACGCLRASPSPNARRGRKPAAAPGGSRRHTAGVEERERPEKGLDRGCSKREV